MTKQTLDQIAQNYTTQEELVGKSGILDKLFQKTLQTALDAALTNHLGYEKNTPEARNKTIQTVTVKKR